MKLKILFSLLFFFFIVTPAFAGKPVRIGADLKEYKPLNKTNCDISVPIQYASIQAAVDAAVNGNSICVGTGTYNEDVLVNKSILLSGRGADKTIINGQDPNASGTVYITAPYVVVEGFLVHGDGNTRGTSAIRQFEQVHDTIVRYNRIIAGSGQVAF